MASIQAWFRTISPPLEAPSLSALGRMPSAQVICSACTLTAQQLHQPEKLNLEGTVVRL